ncbi:MAG TPA: hypothetical protein VM488_00060 [Pseudobacter sp.]|nr:hypothetical protein [Pseudobacter sp.]
MKILAISLTLFAITFAGCSKKKSAAAVGIPDGTYTGTFTRWPMATASTITITLKDKKFSGSSSLDNYPSICHGIFVVENKSLMFLDICSSYYEQDPTLMLNKEYEFSMDGRTLRFTRHYSDVKYDEYKLTRQP